MAAARLVAAVFLGAAAFLGAGAADAAPGLAVVLVRVSGRSRLERALAAIRPRIDAAPATFDMESSTRAFKTIDIKKGDVDAAFASAAANGFVEIGGEYHTDSQEQLYIEPNGMIATHDPTEGVTVWGSLQCPYYIQKALKPLFNLPPDKVRVGQPVSVTLREPQG